jgi:hypothetical protein
MAQAKGRAYPERTLSFIVRSLELLLQNRKEIEEEEREKQQVMRPQRKKDAGPPTFECRVCKLRSADGSYCPTCLADTMVAIKER